MMFAPPSVDELEAAVDRLLANNPDKAPTTSDIACAFGTTPRGLRRAWRLGSAPAARSGPPNVRTALIVARVRYAAARIRTGDKILAARTAAGFRDTFNFNRQFERCYGCTPQEYRARFVGAADKSESVASRTLQAD